MEHVEFDLMTPADVAAMISPLQADIAALTERVDQLERAGHGQTMPDDIPAGWRETVRQDFPIACAEGQFATVYPRSVSGIGFYPRGYFDTRWKQNRANGQAIRGGEYSADFISVADSICRQRMFVRSNVVQCSALVPIANATNGTKWGDTAGVIIEQRTRFTFSAGLKAAHLLWPQSDKSLRPAAEGGGDGEIDYPEFEEADPVDCWIHHQGATVNTDQKEIVGDYVIDPRQWHVYRLEWVMGKSVRIWCDGVLVATYTNRIPATPMHIVLQNESWLDTAAVPADAQGLVETDWIRVLVPA